MSAISVNLDDLEQVERSDQDQERIDEARTRATELFEEFEILKEELEPLEESERRREVVRQAIRSRENVETPAGGGLDVFSRQKRDPFEDLDSVRMGVTHPADVRARAVSAIEQYADRHDHWALAHDGAEHATRLVERSGVAFGTEVARQMLNTGSPEYLQAFENYLNDPGGFASRAALSLTPANGGYLVPFTLDPSIILTNAGSANPYRQVATIKTTTTNNWNGVTSAGVSAEWTAEGTEAADASPTVGQLTITPQKIDAYISGSFEVLSDSDFGQQLPDLLADAKDRIEENGFAVGTGTGQALGVVTAGTSFNFATGSAAAGPSTTDVFNLMAQLPARFRGPRANNVWLANLNTINILRTRALFSGAVVPLLTDGPNGPMLLGKPVYESTSINGVNANAAKVLVWLDARQFYIVDRIGMSVVYDPVVIGTNRRPTGQGAWYAFWRVGSGVSTATAIRVGADVT
jgi:HK97 family phage major capsid protein